MALWVLDTDSLSLFQRGHPALLPRIQALPGTQIAISIVSVQEMPQGRLAQIRRAGSGEDRVRAGAERPLAAEEGGRGHIGRMSPYCGTTSSPGRAASPPVRPVG
jgi:predicted nucleic acid-binding protein